MSAAPERTPEPRVLPEIYRLRPWYHDFSALGLETRFDRRHPQPVRAILGLRPPKGRPTHLKF